MLSPKGVTHMGKGRSFLEQLATESGIDADAIPGKPIVEISGDDRVLIENHFGVKAYSTERILVRVKFGFVCIGGCRLELMRMTKEQLVICGKIHSVILKRGHSA